jgi:hypothetical protein
VEFYAIKILHTALVSILLLNFYVHEQFQGFPACAPLHACLRLVIAAAVFSSLCFWAPAAFIQLSYQELRSLFGRYWLELLVGMSPLSGENQLLK